MLTRCPTPKLQDHSLLVVRVCPFIVSAAVHIQRSSPSAARGHFIRWWQGTHLTCHDFKITYIIKIYSDRELSAWTIIHVLQHRFLCRWAVREGGTKTRRRYIEILKVAWKNISGHGCWVWRQEIKELSYQTLWDIRLQRIGHGIQRRHSRCG